jgi:hypothetical protein
MIGLIVHQQRYQPSDSNKNIDIRLSMHDTFLEYDIKTNNKYTDVIVSVGCMFLLLSLG